MPFIGSRVTVKISKEKEEILKTRLAEAAESCLGKPEKFLMVGFEDEYTLYFGGDKLEKGAFVEVKILGKATREEFEEMTAEICKIYGEELGIPQDKIYVKYEEVQNWGWNGSNF
ncbi:phenylpyruvate tautomerase MIF-related protein [Clostridium sp. SM-530-WT-3G]|uniref:phenylpyruvate tautomerase MIF-related protein n=1 Tax=Clostridium sp. SM-530-WT-3G TaxID=2725303 RepID=UPI00145C8E95|nr:phenylpyruvate tautomerase MIF-related protein [Clostridium sp. SM-530-WT-3G]NME82061.1 hypothetical protein [Clostridium sp. SM-530-WT-3G]